MPNASKQKYQLYVVNENLGWYPVLNCSNPTEDFHLLENLAEIVKSLRPGYNKSYTLTIARHSEDCIELDEIEKIMSIARNLRSS